MPGQPDEVVRWVGSKEPLIHIRGALLRTLATGSGTLIGVAGACGSGKSTLVALAAAERSVPFVQADLAAARSPEDLRQILGAALKRQKADRPGILFFTNFIDASIEVRSELGFLWRRGDPARYVDQGELTEVGTGQWLWVVEFSATQSEYGGQPMLLAPYALPRSLVRNLGSLVVLRQHTPSELYELLTLSELSPLKGMRQRLSSANLPEPEFSEMALHAIVNEATKAHPEFGAHGLFRVIDHLEARIWAQLAAASEVAQENLL